LLSYNKLNQIIVKRLTGKTKMKPTKQEEVTALMFLFELELRRGTYTEEENVNLFLDYCNKLNKKQKK